MEIIGWYCGDTIFCDILLEGIFQGFLSATIFPGEADEPAKRVPRSHCLP
jgi:hypothetical protein